MLEDKDDFDASLCEEQDISYPPSSEVCKDVKLALPLYIEYTYHGSHIACSDDYYMRFPIQPMQSGDEYESDLSSCNGRAVTATEVGRLDNHTRTACANQSRSWSVSLSYL